ncbi:hypothetical protein ACH470_31575 [Streptomyces bottropensis]|uniref:hypothetical protein n=1 Tax=Streptomyces bottropensis TaxID=42235 RepID=UPI0037B02903
MEFARTSIGLLAAISVPAGLGWFKKLPGYAVTFTFLYGAIVVLPESREIDAWLTLIGLVGFAVCAAVFERPWGSSPVSWSWVPTPTMTPLRYAAAVGAVAAAFLLAYLGRHVGWDSARTVIADDDRFLITVSGLLVAVFGCQFFIASSVKSLIREIRAKISSGDLPESVNEFIKVGPHVGWIERFILFSFLVSGSPEAAALVVTAKSFARAPGAREGGKLVGDYYLIGTLVSVAAALAASSLTRLALGLSPL